MEQNIKNIFSDFAIQIEKDVKYDNYSDRDIINKWTAILLNLNNEFKKESDKLSLKELYSETLLAVSNKKENNTLFGCVTTGLNPLDRIIGGLPFGELIVLGARPAMGKTALMITIMANSIINKNEPIGFFSMENSAQYIMLRLLSNIAQIGHHALVSKILEPYEINELYNKTNRISDANITIEDDCYTIDDIITKTHLLVTEKGVKLIIVDYLQLVQVKGKMNREQENAKVCRELKAIARKYNIAVLACSQLSRAVETRGGDKRPQLSDLRESGAIEQDADKVLFLHRPEYYNITEDENGMSSLGIAEIIVAKNRGGCVDSAKVKFLAPFSSYIELDSEMIYSSADNKELEPFKNIRNNEFDTNTISLQRGSKMNDIEEDHPF